MDNCDNDRVTFHRAHRSHHSPFQIRKALALADSIALLRHGHGADHDQVDLVKTFLEHFWFF